MDLGTVRDGRTRGKRLTGFRKLLFAAVKEEDDEDVVVVVWKARLKPPSVGLNIVAVGERSWSESALINVGNPKNSSSFLIYTYQPINLPTLVSLAFLMVKQLSPP